MDEHSTTLRRQPRYDPTTAQLLTFQEKNCTVVDPAAQLFLGTEFQESDVLLLTFRPPGVDRARIVIRRDIIHGLFNSFCGHVNKQAPLPNFFKLIIIGLRDKRQVERNRKDHLLVKQFEFCQRVVDHWSGEAERNKQVFTTEIIWDLEGRSRVCSGDIISFR